MSFPRMLVARPPQNTKPAAGVRPAEKPLGYVVATPAPAPIETAAKPAADVAAPRQTGGYGRVAPSVAVARPKPPVPATYVKHYDKYGRETIRPEDIPW
jgi:hypothetical protein